MLFQFNTFALLLSALRSEQVTGTVGKNRNPAARVWTQVCEPISMKKAMLVFPDVVSLTDFVMVYRVKGIEVKSADLVLCGVLSEREYKAAIDKYGAEPAAVQTV